MQPFKILFIAPMFPPQEGPESYVNGKLAIALRRNGWHLDVITQAPTSIVKDTSNLWNKLNDCTYYLKQRNIFNNFILQTIFWLYQAYCLAMRLHKKNKYHVILSRAQPIWGHVLAWLLTIRTDVAWIANWNDPAPIRRYPPPYGFGPDAPMSAFSSYLFNKICSKANWHTFPCERLRNYMISYMPKGTANKSSVIAHIFLEDVAQNSSCLAKQHEKLILCHSGSTYYRNWQQFLLAFKMFIEKEHVNDVQVNFVGWQPDDFRQTVIKYKLTDHIIIEPPVLYDASFSCLTAADILLLIEAGCNEGIFMPSKIADYAGAKKPLLAVSPTNGTMADLIKKYNWGLVADCGSVESIYETLKILYSQWKTGNLDKIYNAQSAYDLFTEKNIINEYNHLFHTLNLKKT